jgi:hypothetical protein
MTTYEDRGDEQDWPEEDTSHRVPQEASDLPVPPEPEDDAARLPTRHPSRRRPNPHRHAKYRPPSELDHE